MSVRLHAHTAFGHGKPEKRLRLIFLGLAARTHVGIRFDSPACNPLQPPQLLASNQSFMSLGKGKGSEGAEKLAPNSTWTEHISGDQP